MPVLTPRLRAHMHACVHAQGYHMAEALRMPCAAAAPYQVPYTCPGSFKRRFLAVYGTRLYGLLTEAEADGGRRRDVAVTAPGGAGSSGVTEDEASQPLRHAETEGGGGGSGLLGRLPRLSWREVVHWMWPLFSERWTRIRSELLALAPSPLHDRVTLRPLDRLPQAVPLLYGG